MNYLSTRGRAPTLDFVGVLLAGLASDGGLYVPEKLPEFDVEEIASWRGESFAALARRLLTPFLNLGEGGLSAAAWEQVLESAWGEFNHPDVVPLTEPKPGCYLLELFHGPTLAFKDVALQLFGHLLDRVGSEQRRFAILGATSGDTGSAAIEGCRHCARAEIFILFPAGGISAVQRRQMTTVAADNVHCLEVAGNFDDCQHIVKECFSRRDFLPADCELVAVNSINWTRVMVQVVYYFAAVLAANGARGPVSFAVPTGNFGDAFAGYLARGMGLPIERLIIATNANDILHRCISRNDYSLEQPHKTLAPSMDIQAPSNFERLLFDLLGRDGAKVAELMEHFPERAITLPAEHWERARAVFDSARLDDRGICRVIRDTQVDCGTLLDPHSAIAWAAAEHSRRLRPDIPVIAMATAHPAKFPEAMAQAGVAAAPLPPGLEDLMERPERLTPLPCHVEAVQQYMARVL